MGHEMSDMYKKSTRLPTAWTKRSPEILRTFRGLRPMPSLSLQQDRGSDLAVYRSRLSESNRRPTHYECVALAN